MINKSTRHHFSNESFTSLKKTVKECDMLQMNGQRIENKICNYLVTRMRICAKWFSQKSLSKNQKQHYT